MLVAGFPAGPWGTNCFVVAASAGAECLVVDPGKDAAGPVADAVREHRLRPVAVLLTHGHLDHTWSVVPVASGYGIPAYLHPADRHLLDDPLAGLGADTAAMLGRMAGLRVPVGEPDDLRLLDDGLDLDLAGVRLRVAHAPGHTAGSVAFTAPPDAGRPPVMFSGDLLFEGSIGRTDLPGGDHGAMLASLARVVLTADDATVVLPGHGPQTTVGAERAANPYLRALAPAGPARGL